MARGGKEVPLKLRVGEQEEAEKQNTSAQGPKKPATPDQPVTGKVVFVSYATTVTPSGVLAYTARADLTGSADLRLGLKGTAKIFGPPRPLAVWLLRRPLAYLRQLVA